MNCIGDGREAIIVNLINVHIGIEQQKYDGIVELVLDSKYQSILIVQIATGQVSIVVDEQFDKFKQVGLQRSGLICDAHGQYIAFVLVFVVDIGLAISYQILYDAHVAHETGYLQD